MWGKSRMIAVAIASTAAALSISAVPAATAGTTEHPCPHYHPAGTGIYHVTVKNTTCRMAQRIINDFGGDPEPGFYLGFHCRGHVDPEVGEINRLKCTHQDKTIRIYTNPGSD